MVPFYVRCPFLYKHYVIKMGTYIHRCLLSQFYGSTWNNACWCWHSPSWQYLLWIPVSVERPGLPYQTPLSNPPVYVQNIRGTWLLQLHSASLAPLSMRWVCTFPLPGLLLSLGHSADQGVSPQEWSVHLGRSVWPPGTTIEDNETHNTVMLIYTCIK